jgi:hypothetical protein
MTGQNLCNPFEAGSKKVLPAMMDVAYAYAIPQNPFTFAPHSPHC